MELPVLHTQKQKIVLNMVIDYKQPADVRIIGYDKNHTDTVYFDRIANPGLKGDFSVDFPLPLSPNKLAVEITCDTPNCFDIKTLGASFLKPVGVDLYPQEIEFLKLYLPFCKHASYKPNGYYFQPNGPCSIKYEDYIIDSTEGKLTTPARVDHNSGEIQISSAMFKKFTVPQRVIIGAHEHSHWFYDNTDETFCDINALRICLGLGFPKTECIYTFTNILSSTHENDKRLEYIVNYINNFKQTN